MCKSLQQISQSPKLPFSNLETETTQKVREALFPPPKDVVVNSLYTLKNWRPAVAVDRAVIAPETTQTEWNSFGTI